MADEEDQYVQFLNSNLVKHGYETSGPEYERLRAAALHASSNRYSREQTLKLFQIMKRNPNIVAPSEAMHAGTSETFTPFLNNDSAVGMSPALQGGFPTSKAPYYRGVTSTITGGLMDGGSTGQNLFQDGLLGVGVSQFVLGRGQGGRPWWSGARGSALGPTPNTLLGQNSSAGLRWWNKAGGLLGGERATKNTLSAANRFLQVDAKGLTALKDVKLPKHTYLGKNPTTRLLPSMSGLGRFPILNTLAIGGGILDTLHKRKGGDHLASAISALSRDPDYFGSGSYLDIAYHKRTGEVLKNVINTQHDTGRAAFRDKYTADDYIEAMYMYLHNQTRVEDSHVRGELAQQRAAGNHGIVARKLLWSLGLKAHKGDKGENWFRPIGRKMDTESMKYVIDHDAKVTGERVYGGFKGPDKAPKGTTGSILGGMSRIRFKPDNNLAWNTRNHEHLPAGGFLTLAADYEGKRQTLLEGLRIGGDKWKGEGKGYTYGELLFRPDSGQYFDSANGRAYFNQSKNEALDNILNTDTPKEAATNYLQGISAGATGKTIEQYREEKKLKPAAKPAKNWDQWQKPDAGEKFWGGFLEGLGF